MAVKHDGLAAADHGDVVHTVAEPVYAVVHGDRDIFDEIDVPVVVSQIFHC